MKNNKISEYAGIVATICIICMAIVFIYAMITNSLLFDEDLILHIIFIGLISLFIWIFYNDEDDNEGKKLISG